MKLYISVDIEGITGVTSWKEAELGQLEHAAAAKQMTAETLAACEAAIEMGADEIYIKDAHDSGRNMDITGFPKEVKIIRDWYDAPESMMVGLDASFDGVIFIGYHSGAGYTGNPLSHTMSTACNYMKINGTKVSEFTLNAYLAASYNIPVIFLSGDKMLCDTVKTYNDKIETVGVKEGVGGATINLSPSYVCALIKQGIKKGVEKRNNCKVTLPQIYHVEINYKNHKNAYRAAFYPGVTLLEDGYSVSYDTDTIQDLMTTRMFIL